MKLKRGMAVGYPVELSNRNVKRNVGNQRRCQLILTLAFVLTLTVEALAADASRLTIGLNFTGSTLVDSGVIVPDTVGAVGESHIVELLNGHYAVYRKSDGYECRPVHWPSSGLMPGSL